MEDLSLQIEDVFRRESGRILAGLIRVSRSFDAAEEVLQESFAIALTHWTRTGIPDNPAAWITTAAQRKLIDEARKQRTRRVCGEQLRYESPVSCPSPDSEQLMTFPCKDERLSLIFTCCHPALNREAQIALTLRTLGGLTTAEIARAFLIPEPSLAQRIVRAKRKILEARIPYQVPGKDLLPERLGAVQAVLYLIFNEGYTASHGTALLRCDLSSEAIRLARTLCDLMPENAENMGLLALMLLHDSRRNTRMDDAGDLVLLEDQDRVAWNHSQISEGLHLTRQALRRRALGPYQLQAAIAAVHAEAKAAAETDWRQIAALYGELARFQPSATVALNRAVATALSGELEQGIAMIEAANEKGALDGYYLFHAARADLLRRQGKNEAAHEAYTRALVLTRNEVEARFLRKRLSCLKLDG